MNAVPLIIQYRVRIVFFCSVPRACGHLLPPNRIGAGSMRELVYHRLLFPQVLYGPTD